MLLSFKKLAKGEKPVAKRSFDNDVNCITTTHVEIAKSGLTVDSLKSKLEQKYNVALTQANFYGQQVSFFVTTDIPVEVEL